MQNFPYPLHWIQYLPWMGNSLDQNKIIYFPNMETPLNLHWVIRDWSKSIGGGGGPEQRGGGSWGFEPCARGGSCNFQLPSGGGSPYFLLTTNEKVDYTCYIKHSQLELLLKYSQTFCARKYKSWQVAHLYGRGTLCQPFFFRL